jgi:uncharacterized membrane protein
MSVPFTLTFLGVKLFDIGYVTFLFFIFGLIFAKGFDLLYGKFNKDKYKNEPKWKLLLEIIVHVFAIGVVAYILRNIVELIPFPFEGVAGFRHSMLKELEGGHVMTIVLILFQKNLEEKVKYFGESVLEIN